MKNIKYALLLFIIAGSLSSCMMHRHEGRGPDRNGNGRSNDHHQDREHHN